MCTQLTANPPPPTFPFFSSFSAPFPKAAWDHPRIEWRVGDIADKQAVMDVCKGADCVWHNAAAVGPFHPQELYDKVRRKVDGKRKASRGRNCHALIMLWLR